MGVVRSCSRKEYVNNCNAKVLGRQFQAKYFQCPLRAIKLVLTYILHVNCINFRDDYRAEYERDEENGEC